GPGSIEILALGYGTRRLRSEQKIEARGLQSLDGGAATTIVRRDLRLGWRGLDTRRPGLNMRRAVGGEWNLLVVREDRRLGWGAGRGAARLAGCPRPTAGRRRPGRQSPGVPLPVRADEPHSPVLPPSVVGRLFEVSEHRPQPQAPGGRPWSKRRAPRRRAPRPDGPQVERQSASAPPRPGGRVPPPPRQGRCGSNPRSTRSPPP